MLELDKNTFEQEVLKDSGSVVVDFYGDGCAPCAALMPHMHRLAEKYGDSIKFCALNTSKARRLAISQGILGLPAVVIYQDGKMNASCIKEEATVENVESMIRQSIHSEG